MHRKDLTNKITVYNPEFDEEVKFRVSFLSFIRQHTDCFERSLKIGHITGSAWIINQSRDKALLTHHRKLNRWLQLGGHADGDSDIIRVASKEAEEESGLKSLRLLETNIFDIDIHTIPARKEDPEHLHYDVRFLFEADENEELIVSNESKELAWVSFDELKKVTNENDSILRMVKKC